MFSFTNVILANIFETQEQQDWEPGKYYLASLNFGGLQDSSSFQVSKMFTINNILNPVSPERFLQ